MNATLQLRLHIITCFHGPLKYVVVVQRCTSPKGVSLKPTAQPITLWRTGYNGCKFLICDPAFTASFAPPMLRCLRYFLRTNNRGLQQDMQRVVLERKRVSLLSVLEFLYCISSQTSCPSWWPNWQIDCLERVFYDNVTIRIRKPNLRDLFFLKTGISKWNEKQPWFGAQMVAVSSAALFFRS